MDCGLLVALESLVLRDVEVHYQKNYLEVDLVSRKDLIADGGLNVGERVV